MRKISEGKTKSQALVCVMRRLVNIIYGMMVNRTEYREPVLQVLQENSNCLFMDKEVPSNVAITGLTANTTTLPVSGLIVVPSSTMIPISIINSTYQADVELHSKEISDWLIQEGITLNQKEFDALVIYRYNRGHLSNNAMSYLKSGNRSQTDWQKVWTGGQNRKDKCQDLFFGGNY